MFITAKEPNPSDTDDDSGNDLLSLEKLIKKYQLSSKQLIEYNQLKSLGNRTNSSRISLASLNQTNSRNHWWQLTCISFLLFC